MLDLQKASLLKRVSAYILDMILVLILTTGFAVIFSWMLGYSAHEEAMDARRDYFIEKHGITEFAKEFTLTEEEYNKLPKEQQDAYVAAYEEFAQDPEANYAYNMVITLSFLIITLAVLLAYIALEFVVPLFLGAGMSVGRKVFSIGVMHENFVKMTPTTLFVRSILGKCTIETMVPIYLVLLIVFGQLGLVGLIVLAAMLVLQLGLVFGTRSHATIHDLLSHTVAVDYSSQMIFDTEEDLLRYKSELARRNAEKQTY